jgi:hypothetical protein
MDYAKPKKSEGDISEVKEPAVAYGIGTRTEADSLAASILGNPEAVDYDQDIFDEARTVKDAGKTAAVPVINPADYDNDTDYLMAIPGMEEKLIRGMNAPESKCKRVPKEYFNV